MQFSGKATIFCVFATVVLLAGADPVPRQDRLHLADGLFRRTLFDLAAQEYALLAEEADAADLPGILFRLGECQRRLKRSDLAETSYRRLLTTAPDSPYVPRARLQLALIGLNSSSNESLREAATVFTSLTTPNMPDEVRPAALYHLGETQEKLGLRAEALATYTKVTELFAATDYGVYAGLRSAALLNKDGSVEERRKALGIYLELSYKSKDPKVVEEALFFASRLSLFDDHYEECINLFKTLCTKFPLSHRIAQAALGVAWANFHTTRFQEGIKTLELVINDRSHPEREEILYVQANCMRQLERRKDAVTTYTMLLQEFPEGRLSSRAWYEKLITLYHGGEYAEVLATASQRTSPPEEYADNVYWICAESSLTLENYETAVQYCRLLVTQYPESPFVKDTLYRLGWLLQKQEAWESALSWFNQVVKRFPDDPLASKALYAAGSCHVRLGQSEIALREWTTLLAKYPDSEEVAETLYRKALEELRSKHPRAAGATLDERMRRFPDDARKAEVYYWRAVVYRQSDDTAAAEKMFRTCLDAFPPKELEREVILELGMIMQQAGRKKEAAIMFQQLLDAPIKERLGVDRLAWLAEFQIEQEQPDSAKLAANALLAMKPDKGWQQTAWTLIGRIHRAKNERDPAIAAFKEALDTGANTVYGAEAALRLGELLTEAGEFEAAEAQLNNAAVRAASPELVGLRARAYAGLAKNAELKGDKEAALRYNMSVGILFDDPVIVPEAIHKAAILLDQAGRSDEAQKMRAELSERYPDSPLVKHPEKTLPKEGNK